MPRALVVALHVRDAAGLTTPAPVPAPAHTKPSAPNLAATAAVPPLEPAVALNAELLPHATEAAAVAWSAWWESSLDRHPEFRGVPPLVPDPFPELDVNLRALIGIGLPTADAWFEAREREQLDVLRSTQRPPTHVAAVGIGEIVREVEADLGRTAAPFDLLISVLPVTGLWATRARRDHVLVSRALTNYRPGLETFLEPVIRDLAQES